MAAQRITVAKIAGRSADVVLLRLEEWAAARRPGDPGEWSDEQWPPSVRRRAGEFADRLRAQALSPPVVHFAEWADLWSMGDVFVDRLTPSGGADSSIIHADRFERERLAAGWPTEKGDRHPAFEPRRRFC